MKQYARAGLVCLLLGLGALPAPGPAAAYVPVGGHLLVLAADRIDDSPPAVVRQIRRRAASPGQALRQYDEIVYLQFPGAFRSELSAADGKRVLLERGGRRWVVGGGSLLDAPTDPLDLAIRLLVQTRPESISQVLAEQGVDVRVTSLGRFNGRVGFVLGARYPDESASQVWFDTETLLPFRWLMIRPTADGPPDRTEIRYFAWQKAGALHYPQAMTCYHSDQLISEVRVGGIQAPAEVPGDLLRPDRLPDLSSKEETEPVVVAFQP